MGNCKDCRFWGGLYSLKMFNEHGVYETVYASQTHHICNRLHDFDIEETDTDPKLESFEDTTFTTPSSYGCVLFEAKDAKD